MNNWNKNWDEIPRYDTIIFAYGDTDGNVVVSVGTLAIVYNVSQNNSLPQNLLHDWNLDKYISQKNFIAWMPLPEYKIGK